ncbi:MAG: DUF1501 domain-containing protein, partial [Planctomycetaceae bacterium]|nr:DUF1501 domain-containing protein [Planctomycetaceae bacterium]
MNHSSFCGRTRREFLWQSGAGFTGTALAGLLSEDGFFSKPAGAAEATDGQPAGWNNPLAPKEPHFPPKATSVIFLYMYGGPSHIDTFDYKPNMKGMDNKTVDVETFGRGGRRNQGRIVEPRWDFQQYGECGKWISDLFPHLGQEADEIAFLHSMTADSPIHGSAMLMMNSGRILSGSPCLGSWVTYGLGSMNQNLPGFVVLITGQVLGAGNSAWGSGFLPTIHQGIEFRSQGDPVLFLSNPKGIDPAGRREVVDTVNALNQIQLADVRDPEIATRIGQYEMAYRMQSSVPELMDIDSEPAAIHEMYGTEPGKTSFANNCLLARRLVERGVRFVQLFDQGWDHHCNVFGSLPKKAKEVDRPVAALIKDLKMRGLLDDTLVVWSAEFGRTPMAQGQNGSGEVTKA